MYEEALGVKRDMKKAADLYTKSAKQGFSKAQHRLGLLYYYGIGVKEDVDKAIYWNKQAAAQGDIFAQSSLGAIYCKLGLHKQHNDEKHDHKDDEHQAK